MTDEHLAGIGLVLLAFGAGLVVGTLLGALAGGGVVAAIFGVGLLIYALVLSPTPVPPEA